MKTAIRDRGEVDFRGEIKSPVSFSQTWIFGPERQNMKLARRKILFVGSNFKGKGGIYYAPGNFEF